MIYIYFFILGTVPDTLSSAYTTAAALPHHQYAGSLYSPSHPLTTSNLAATAASIVAGKQIEGKHHRFILFYLLHHTEQQPFTWIPIFFFFAYIYLFSHIGGIKSFWIKFMSLEKYK